MKSKFLSLIASAALVLSAITLPAKAVDVGGFNVGVSAGVIGNKSQFTTNGSETEGGGDSEVTKAEESESHAFPSWFGEIGVRTGLLGINIGYENVPFDANLGAKTRTDVNDAKDTNDDGAYKAEAEVSDYHVYYIEPQIWLNDNLAIYGKFGRNDVTVKSMENIAQGENSSTYGDASVDGDVIGAGIRFKSDLGFLIKIEYQEIDYETVTLTSTTGNANTIKGDIDQVSGRIAIGWQF